MSLLLDALRQAEKNKAHQNEDSATAKNENAADDSPLKPKVEPEVESKVEPQSNQLSLADHQLLPAFELAEDNDQETTEEKQLNTKSDSEHKDDQLVELQVLSEFDLATENTSVETAEHINNLNLTDQDNHAEVKSDADLAADIIAPLELETVEEIKADDTSGDFDYSTEESINYSAIKQVKPSANKVDLTENIKKNIERVIESSAKDSAPLTTQTENTLTEEKIQAVENTEAVNILQASSPEQKNRTPWLIMFFLIALLLSAGYLYYQTLPQNVETEFTNIKDEQLDAVSGIDNDAEYIQNQNAALQNSLNQNPQKTQVLNSALDTANIDPVLSVMAKPEKTISPHSMHTANENNATQTNSSLADFSVETDETTIDYPKQVKIKVKQQQSKVIRNLNSAYTFYLNKDYDQAKLLYQRVLHKDKVNTDALLALGAIAEQQGLLARAQLFYQKVLLVNANHLVARNALIRLHTSQNPTENESLYKSLLEQFPDNAQAYAALANIHASKQRWHDAQKAYFKAVELSPENADFNYNLAISLDQLSKMKLALKYYLMALQLGQTNPHTFDMAVVELRTQQLQE